VGYYPCHTGSRSQRLWPGRSPGRVEMTWSPRIAMHQR
jgi:hypothetical protein